MKAKKLSAKLRNRFTRRIFLIPPYLNWAEEVREMLSDLALIRIDYAHYHGESDDKFTGMVVAAETAMTDLLIAIGTAEKELENETLEDG